MRTYIISTEDNRMIAEVNNEIEAEMEITRLEEEDKMEGLYKEGFYSYITTDNIHSYGEKVETVEENEFETAKKMVMDLFEEAVQLYNEEKFFPELTEQYKVEAQTLKRVLRKAFGTEVEFK